MNLLRSNSVRVGIVIVFVAAVGSFWGIRSIRNSNANQLFAGPCDICPLETPRYFERVNYNLAEYLKAEDPALSAMNNSAYATNSAKEEISYVDGEDRDEVEAAIRKRALENKDKASAENPAVAKLQSPTVYRDRKPARSLQVRAPGEGAVYPPNLCPPYIEWEDPRNNLWQVGLRFGKDGKEHAFVVESKRWRIPASLWKEMGETPNSDVVLQVRGIIRDEKGARAGNVQASPEVRFRISSDRADDYIVFRLVDPPFSSFKTPNIFIRDIRKDEPETFLKSRRQYCLNCHTFSSKQGNTGKLAMQVRSLVTTMHKLPVYVAIYDFDKHSGYKVQLPFEIQMTTFMSWSPDGNQLAYSANQKVVAFKPIIFETQLAGMATSDIAVYDVEKNDTWLVPGASDPNLLEVYPCWTPDRKSMIFSRSPVGLHPAHIHYDLYRIDLEGDPNPRPVGDASDNGRSNYFARFSPDSKWMSYCRCDGGDLIRSSSDLYLMPGDLKGPSRKLACNVDVAADSWHSWSSNSRWIVFASKRDSGIYAYLYLTHIDENGNASPAVPLPLIERPFASYNIPEFVAQAPQVNEEDLFDPMRAETKPILANLRKIEQGNPHVEKEKSGES